MASETRDREHFLVELAHHARQADEERAWPKESWNVLRQMGALRWAIPRAYGGEALTGVDLLEAYESLAGACLTTTFILSQRDAAIRRLRDIGPASLSEELLPALARGERFASVGLAQLTTSRQHGKPAVLARADGDDYIIDGIIPWVTAAPRADHLVTGAVVEGGQQILAVLPTSLPGVRVGQPLELMALQGSLTSEVHCEKVRLKRRWLLCGPTESALQAARGGTGGLETSCLGLGLAGAAIRHIRQEAEGRPELAPDAERLQNARQKLRNELFRLVTGPAEPNSAQVLRARVNTLVLHATQAALTASKGTGFLRHHPAQRWARQALFFLVWSCPAPVASATLSFLSTAGEQICS